MQLYKYTEDYLKHFTALKDMGLDQETFNNTMSAISAEFDDKAYNVAAYIKNSQAKVNAYKEHEAEVAKKRKTLEGNIEYMKDYLRDNMVAVGKDRIESRLIAIKLGKPSQSVYVSDIDLLPDDLVVVKKSADKKIIGKMLKDGHSVDGAELVDGKSKLTIG